MLPPRIDDITEEHLQALVSGEIRECKTLEFKAKLNISSDGEKKEALADISSFANADGGDILYGIEELDGVAATVVGMEGFDPDKDQLRVEEIIRNGIQPRILGLQLKSVKLQTSRHVLIVRLPSSLNQPHMVIRSSKFFSRNSAGKYALDVTELRAAFLASESLMDRIRQYRLERIDSILQGNTPESIRGTARICLHLIPIQAFNPGFQFSLAEARQASGEFRPMHSSGYSPGVNFDGLVSSDRIGEETTSYVQLFRNGAIEAVESRLLNPIRSEESHFIPSNAYEETILEGFTSFCIFYKSIGMPLPIVIGLSLLGVRGYRMFTGASRRCSTERSIDRENLILPARFLEAYEVDAGTFLRPVFDQIWNACGWPGSINYREDGEWRRHS